MAILSTKWFEKALTKEKSGIANMQFVPFKI